MATISTLAVNLIARTSAFEKGMNRSRFATKSLKSTINGAIGTVARFGKGLLIAAGVGGIGFAIKKTMAMIDVTAKLSDRLGIATEKLIGLRHAASIAGVSSDALDKSLEIFVRRMGEVKAGSGEAKKGLEALGLSAEEMINMTPDKSLLIIAERIKNLGTQAEKASAAYFLFGRAGAQLLNLFEGGAANIEAMQKEAERLGITFSRFDAAKVEEANDAITKLKGALQGVVTEITISLSPAILRVTNFLIKYRDSMLSTIKNTVIFVAKTVLIVKAVSLVGAAVRGLIAVYKTLAVSQSITLALGGPAGWAILAAGVAVATAAIIGINEAIDGTISKLKEFGESSGEVKSKLPQITDFSNLEKVALEKERLLIARQIRIEQREIAFWGDRWGEDVTDNIDRLAELNRRLGLISRRYKDIENQAVALELSTKQTELSIELEKAMELAQNQVDNFDLSPIEVKIKSLLKKGDELFSLRSFDKTEEAKEFIGKINELGRLQAQIEQKKTFKKLKDEANALKESLKGPAGKLNDIRERLAEMLEQGFISTDEFDKGLAKAKESLGLDLDLGLGKDTNFGRFQEIRSEFIDVAALNAGKTENGVGRTNELLQKSLFIQQQALDESRETFSS
jgi:hypothetical protein